MQVEAQRREPEDSSYSGCSGRHRERRRPCTRLVELINFALNVAKLISSLAASTVVGAAQTNSSQTAGRNRTENVYLVQCKLKDVTAVVIKFSQSCIFA